MSTKPQIELFLENESGTQQVAYPFVESDHVSLSNGMDIDTMIRQDVSMPTVTHEDLSFKVGVGDQDVSSAIVDSSIAEMTIKGKTYQNILPEPSTHVLTNNKEMFKVNEGLDPNVEIVDGVSKSAILSGQTLVNVIDEIWFHSEAKHFFYINLKQYEVNKDYLLVMFNAPNEITQIYLGNSSTTMMWRNYTTDFIRNGSTVSLKVTCPSNYDGSTILPHFIFGSSEPSLDEVKQMKAILIPYQEGMENWDIPYFEGMQSVKMPSLTTTGKNLLDVKGIQKYGGTASLTVDEKGVITVVGGGTDTESSAYTNKTVYLEKGKQYTFSCVTDGVFGMVNGTDTVEAFLMEKGGSQAIHQLHTNPRTFTCTSTGDYTLRLDVNMGTKTHTFSNIQVEEGSQATSYEPYKTNTLSTPEEVELRGIDDVKDELNVATGELTQRIGEVVFDGSQGFTITGTPNQENTLCILFHGFPKIANGAVMSDKLIKESNYDYSDFECITQNKYGIGIRLLRNKLESADINGVKKFLSKNPITVQYQLETESIKTVDLSSSGNWEKVVLDGSENWNLNNQLSNANGYYAFHHKPTDGLVRADRFIEIDCDNFTPTIDSSLINKMDSEWCTWYGWNYGINICIKGDRLLTKDANGFKQWLRDNPTSVWYPTNSVKDSTQVKQPIFFKDGHIQLSSGADNSLIPTLDYQAKTSNSYVMDLMKTNTKYTMKAKSASGTFTIDGTSYGAGTNGTFTTPTSMTNKLLVMSNKTNEEVMILEGDVVSKTIPYFKGIKSAFEGEDKIEVLSTGKNLINFKEHTQEWDGAYISNEGGNRITFAPNANGEGGINATFELANKASLKAGTTLTYSCRRVSGGNSDFIGTINNKIVLTYVDGTTKNIFITDFQSSNFDKTITTAFTLEKDCIKIITAPIMYAVRNLHSPVVIEYQLEVSDKATDIEPYKSNVSKIPLLSPLRSLPNGVCDEIILDRENNKAKIVQRVGMGVLDGSAHEAWGFTANDDSGVRFANEVNNMYAFPKTNGNPDGKMFTNSLLPCVFTTKTKNVPYKQAFSVWDNKIVLYLDPSIANVSQLRNYLSQNPITVQYELATPIITEVDLEGFPYVYKDGHIFLDGEIVPVTEIKYSINQQHQIEASNQDIIRHQKEIDYLYKLIGEYVRVDYKNTLLSLNLELK